MNLGQLHDEVRTFIRRGNRFDAEIVSACRKAAKFIEKNYTLKYMEKLKSFQLDKDAADSNVMPVPPGEIKSYKFIRLATPKGWHKLTKMEAEEVNTITTVGLPDIYWLRGLTEIWLDKKPGEDYDGQIMYHQYTTWPTDLNATLDIIDRYEASLVAQSVLQMSTALRDPTLELRAQNQWDKSIKTDLLAETELTESDKSLVMNYGVDYDR